MGHKAISIALLVVALSLTGCSADTSPTNPDGSQSLPTIDPALIPQEAPADVVQVDSDLFLVDYGDVIIGDNCKVGPNCYIRGSTAIGDKCHVGQAVEIKNSILLPGTNVGHLSYLGDSILGEKVNFGAVFKKVRVLW